MKTILPYMQDFVREDCNFETVRGKTSLNYHLALRQEIDKKALDALIASHQKKDEIFAEMDTCDDVPTLRAYAAEVTAIYFEQQMLWNFPQDSNFHQFWEMPQCTCPSLDNRDLLGLDRKIIRSTCPIHGSDISLVSLAQKALTNAS